MRLLLGVIAVASGEEGIGVLRWDHVAIVIRNRFVLPHRSVGAPLVTTHALFVYHKLAVVTAGAGPTAQILPARPILIGLLTAHRITYWIKELRHQEVDLTIELVDRVGEHGSL